MPIPNKISVLGGHHPSHHVYQTIFINCFIVTGSENAGTKPVIKSAIIFFVFLTFYLMSYNISVKFGGRFEFNLIVLTAWLDKSCERKIGLIRNRHYRS